MTLFFFLLPYALRYSDGGDKRFIVHAFVFYLLDVLYAHTWFAIIAGWPKKFEWTISHVLYRLANDRLCPHQRLYYEIAKYINSKSPTGVHIKLWNRPV